MPPEVPVLVEHQHEPAWLARVWASRAPAVLATFVWAVILAVLAVELVRHQRPAGHEHVEPIYQLLAETGAKWATGENVYAHVGEYRYSPLVAALLTPFGLVPGAMGVLMWLGLNVAVFFWGLLWWARVMLADNGRPAGAGTIGLFVLTLTPLTVGNFNNSQANPLVLGLMLAAVAATLRGRWNLVAVCIGAAAALKVYPLALGLVLLVRYPRQLWWRLALAVLIAGAAPFVLQRPGYVANMYQAWFDVLRRDDRSARPPALAYRDLALVLRVCFGVASATLTMGLSLVGATLVGLAAAWRREDHSRYRLWLLLGLVICYILLLGPSTESATYVFLAPVLVWAGVEGLRQQWGFWRLLPLRASYALLLAAVVAAALGHNRAGVWLVIQPIAAMLAVAGLLLRARAPGRRLLPAAPAGSSA